ncbi:hypothetical protein FXO38_17773 [Capsicum annuum]|nr:hypothetical protein FXO37_29908 [Capsicum annuum]KAF3649238.1 hypothetical protein FXO38_17773 [Capsicum annuum]
MKGKVTAKSIKNGLSKTLVFYYPLAGRLIEGPNGKLMVNCTGEGVLFIEANANVELDKLGESFKPPCPNLDLLLHNVPGSDGIFSCPLLLVQISKTNQGWHTQEEDWSAGTYAIGASNEHRSLDESVAQ